MQRIARRSWTTGQRTAGTRSWSSQARKRLRDGSEALAREKASNTEKKLVELLGLSAIPSSPSSQLSLTPSRLMRHLGQQASRDRIRESDILGITLKYLLHRHSYAGAREVLEAVLQRPADSNVPDDGHMGFKQPVNSILGAMVQATHTFETPHSHTGMSFLASYVLDTILSQPADFLLDGKAFSLIYSLADYLRPGQLEDILALQQTSSVDSQSALPSIVGLQNITKVFARHGMHDTATAWMKAALEAREKKQITAIDDSEKRKAKPFRGLSLSDEMSLGTTYLSSFSASMHHQVAGLYGQGELANHNFDEGSQTSKAGAPSRGMAQRGMAVFNTLLSKDGTTTPPLLDAYAWSASLALAGRDLSVPMRQITVAFDRLLNDSQLPQLSYSGVPNCCFPGSLPNPNEYTWSALASAYLRRDQPQRVCDIFPRHIMPLVLAHQIKLDSTLLMAFLQAYNDLGLLHQAIALLDHFGKRTSDNEQSLLHALSLGEPCTEESIAELASQCSSLKQSIQLDTPLLNKVLHLLCKAQLYHSAFQLFIRMQTWYGVYPDEITLNILLKASIDQQSYRRLRLGTGPQPDFTSAFGGQFGSYYSSSYAGSVSVSWLDEQRLLQQDASWSGMPATSFMTRLSENIAKANFPVAYGASRGPHSFLQKRSISAGISRFFGSFGSRASTAERNEKIRKAPLQITHALDRSEVQDDGNEGGSTITMDGNGDSVFPLDLSTFIFSQNTIHFLLILNITTTGIGTTASRHAIESLFGLVKSLGYVIPSLKTLTTAIWVHEESGAYSSQVAAFRRELEEWLGREYVPDDAAVGADRRRQWGRSR